MDPNNLVKAIVDLSIFLEFTDADLLDEDAGVAAMEQLAAELQQMDEADQQEFARRVVALAPSYGPPHAEFVENLPDALGVG